jgi:hypothetical protein
MALSWSIPFGATTLTMLSHADPRAAHLQFAGASGFATDALVH